MKTIQTTEVAEAARIIQGGGIVAFPTETVYGLGADVFNENAIAKIFMAKGRPPDNPLIAHIAKLEDMKRLAREVTPSAEAFVSIFFPGPLTVILPRAAKVPAVATAGLDTIAVRMPRHLLALDFLNACGGPVAAPSANESGRPSPTTYQAVLEDLEGRIDAILCGDQAEVGLESTVVDCTGPAPLVLRAGAIALEQLQEVMPNTRMAESKGDEPARSPGMYHRHYSPRARIVLVDQPHQAPESPDTAYIGFPPIIPKPRKGMQYMCTDLDDYAHELFLFFRVCDAENIRTIYCQRVPETGIGRAIMDRLRRASEGYFPGDMLE